MNMNNRSRKKIAVTVAIVTVMLVGTMTVSLGDNSAFATKEKNQDASQANACGNGELPLDVFCETTTSQVDGEENAVVINGNQVPSSSTTAKN
ncbi:MAG: hypothetical protein ACRD5B_16250 [Nitrososphaeraceae archaeon]